MNHLEKLIRQYYEYQGYIVKGNIKVGRLDHGGWSGEIDIVAYKHNTDHLVHLEPSLDADNWKRRSDRYDKKFKAGKKYIIPEIFPWLPLDHEIEQIALFPSCTEEYIAGGKVIPVDVFIQGIVELVRSLGKVSKNAIPQEFDLLRTIQFTECGYNRSIK